MREFSPKEYIVQGDWVHVFTIGGGQILAFREFLDVHVAVEAFQCFPLTEATGTPPPAPR